MITKPEAIQLALTKKSSEAEQKSLPWVGEQTRRLWTSLCCRRGRDVKTNFMANSVKKAFEGGQLEWANERRTRERFECKCLLSQGAGSSGQARVDRARHQVTFTVNSRDEGDTRGNGGSERDIGVERRTCFLVSTVLLWKMGERLFFRQLAKGDERTAPPPLRRPTNKMLE